MKYIRSCESCKSEIRFPIDKGTLFVTCPYCKYTSRINPDDPLLYSSGRFDIAKKNQNFPEEFFFHQHKEETGFVPTFSTNNYLKKIIVALLFIMLFSHLFKIYNTEPVLKDDFHDSPPTKDEEKRNMEYDI